MAMRWRRIDELGRSRPSLSTRFKAVIKVEVLAPTSASLASAALTIEVLEAANDLELARGRPTPFAIATVGASASRLRPTGRDLHEPASEGTPPDLVIVPDIRVEAEGALAPALGEGEFAWAKARLSQVRDAGGQVAASSGGVVLLAAAGLLEYRRATTARRLALGFQLAFPKVRLEVGAGVIADSGMITAGPPMAHLDLMLSLIARHVSMDLAERCVQEVFLEDRPLHARVMAASFLAQADQRVAMAERWALGRLEQRISITEFASAAGLAPRTFARRVHKATGLSPVGFLQRLRVQQALSLIRTSRLSIDEIAHQVGYSDPSTLRRLLRREGASSVRLARSAKAA